MAGAGIVITLNIESVIYKRKLGFAMGCSDRIQAELCAIKAGLLAIQSNLRHRCSIEIYASKSVLESLSDESYGKSHGLPMDEFLQVTGLVINDNILAKEAALAARYSQVNQKNIDTGTIKECQNT
jgi:hypothetical protein